MVGHKIFGSNSKQIQGIKAQRKIKYSNETRRVGLEVL